METKRAALADAQFVANAEAARERMRGALLAGKRAYIAGVGGGAAEAQHLSAELLGKFSAMRRAFPAVALTNDSAMLTAWANDTSFEYIFSRQLEGFGQEGDLFIIFSAGGNTPCLIEALKVANARGMLSICLLGKGGGKAKDMCTIPIVVPSDVTAHIQETHLALLHFFCQYLEEVK